jgi:phosphatidylserine/phosphatidylglycerophosphate/cardiolipin synthase-like enzyme
MSKAFFRPALLSAVCAFTLSSHALADDIQVFFNATVNAPAQQADLEEKMIGVINQANSTLDIAVYDMDLPGIANAIVDAKSRGVTVRFVTDNDNVGPENQEALTILDSGGVPWVDDTADGSAGSGLQHNKWIVADGRYVLFGSTNMTQSGIHGDLNSNGELVSDGNDNHILIVDSIELAAEIDVQMDYMWGDGPGGNPDSKFGLSKPDHSVVTVFTTNDNTRLDVLFTPQSRSNYVGSGIDFTSQYVSGGTQSIDVAQFVISSQDIVDAMEPLSDAGVNIRGIGDSSFFYRYYSEFQDMAGNVILKDDGTQESDSFTGAPNNPWETPAQVRVANVGGGDKWHHKYIRVDDTVLTGSHNASGAASFTNDEAIVVIYDAETANEFKAHFDTSFCLADGGDETTCYESATPPTPVYEGGTWEGQSLTGEEVGIILDMVNNATMSQLDIDAAMNKRAARNIIKARPILDMEQLAAVPYIGSAAMEDLKLYIPTWN